MGQIERTVDREFADEEAKYKTCVQRAPFVAAVASPGSPSSFEKECQALQKAAKGYSDAMRGAYTRARRAWTTLTS